MDLALEESASHHKPPHPLKRKVFGLTRRLIRFLKLKPLPQEMLEVGEKAAFVLGTTSEHGSVYRSLLDKSGQRVLMAIHVNGNDLRPFITYYSTGEAIPLPDSLLAA